MAGINKVILIGNLGKDPEIRNLDSGVKLARFSLISTCVCSAFEISFSINSVRSSLLRVIDARKCDIEKLSSFGNEVSKKSALMLRWYLEFYRSFGFKGVAMHDPFTVAVAIDPTLVKTKHLFVDVETEGEFTLGKTVVDILGVSGNKPNTDVALELDNERFVSLFEKLMKSYG